MDPRSQPDRPTSSPWLLRRLDQAGVAGLTLAAILGLVGYWFTHGGPSGKLIEIDRAEQETAVFWIDINTAAWPEFTQLPGIGESLARRIVESREARGPFADHDELLRVRGIGPKTLDRIKPFLRPMPLAGNVAGP